MRFHKLPIPVLCSTLLLLGACSWNASAAEVDNWPQFRGPNGNAIAVDQAIPLEFGPNKNVRWKIPVPAGHSSPIVWGNRIFLTGHVGTALKMICLDRTNGAVVWERERVIERIPKYEHVAGNPAASTPATDGSIVCFYFDDYGLVVTDLEGELRWEKRFPATTGNSFSYGASPVIDDGRIYLNRDGGLDSSLVCLDARNGKTLWQADRPDSIVSFCTPYVWMNNGIQQILAGGTGQIHSYDAATGEPLWHVTGLPIFVCPSPVASGDMVYFGGWTTAHVAGRSRIESVFDEESGVSAEAMKDPTAFFQQFDTNRDGRLIPDEFPASRARDAFNFIDKNKDGIVEMAEFAPAYGETAEAPGRNVFFGIAGGGRGDVTESHVKWEVIKGLPYVASPLVYRGNVYLVKKGGFFSGIHAATGEAKFESERLGVAGEYYSTPIAVGDTLIVCAQRGTVLMVRAGDELEVLARNQLGEGIYATPAVVDDTIYLRGENHLWAFAQ